jgi:hypothetical protein
VPLRMIWTLPTSPRDGSLQSLSETVSVGLPLPAWSVCTVQGKMTAVQRDVGDGMVGGGGGGVRGGGRGRGGGGGGGGGGAGEYVC